MPFERITIGKFGRPHGRDGQVRLWLYNDDTELVFPGSKVAIERDGELEEIVITAVQPRGRFVVVAVDAADSREAAAELTNLEISVPRELLPPPDEDEYYGSDLVGFRVLLRRPDQDEPEEIGKLLGFLDNVDTDVFIVTGPRIKKRWLVAFTRAAVGDVDLDAKTLTLNPLEEWAHEDQVLH